MILIILVIVVTILTYVYLLKPLKYWKNKNVKYIQPKILFGNLYESFFAKKAFVHVINDTYQTFKNERYFGMYQMMQPVLVIKDEELIKKITIKDFDSFADHQDHRINKENVDRLWSRNLFTMAGEPWRDMRSTLSPAFTSSKMRSMFFLIDECAKDLVKYIQDENEETVTLELKDTFSRIANDCIASCAFGIKCNSMENKQNDFYKNGRDAFDFTGLKQFNFIMYNACPSIMKLLGLKVISDKMSAYFQTVIKDTIKMREEKSIIRPDMLHLMLEAQKGRLNANDNSENIGDSFASVTEYNLQGNKKKFCISDFDITAQALIFFFGGFDTTSLLMAFVCYELAINTDIQDRLRQEVDDTLSECNGTITYDALMKMKYFDMVVSETLRKWPPASMTDRFCSKEYVIEPEREGETRLVLERGTMVWLPIYPIHRDPKNYPNPEKFDPERFSNENKAKINPSMFVPFGSGPRNCIGSRFALMENKAVLFRLLTKFHIVPVQKTIIPLVLSKQSLNIKAEGGHWFGFKRRSDI